MANWTHKINLAGIFNNDAFDIEGKGKAIASLLEKKFPKLLDFESEQYDSQLDDIVEGFKNITGYDDTTPIEEFDNWMEEFYNWGDSEVPPFGQWPQNKMCWIETQNGRN